VLRKTRGSHGRASKIKFNLTGARQMAANTMNRDKELFECDLTTRTTNILMGLGILSLNQLNAVSIFELACLIEKKYGYGCKRIIREVIEILDFYFTDDWLISSN
jgi:hypothetical protein